ncbi:MAG: hypothetical protein IPJ78_10280 [Gemmatimonadetes bacterium]|nr:hypothetical protein [Gemmatimonadota bacterium]
MLPFYLAARSAARPSQDLLGEALSSSFEAFRHTRQSRSELRDSEGDEKVEARVLSEAAWYLKAFDDAIAGSALKEHPKVEATVRRVVELWESGEKVVVFAFYVHTCRALRVHISAALEQRLMDAVRRRFEAAGLRADERSVERAITTAQDRYFDKPKSPGRRALDARLEALIDGAAARAREAGALDGIREELLDVMRRFLRATSSLARSFPLEHLDDWEHEACVDAFLGRADRSGVTWLAKLGRFLHFIADECGAAERAAYLEAIADIKVGGIQVEDGEADGTRVVTLANIQVAMGETKRETRERLMRAFNTPFFPEILVCSQVMGEGGGPAAALPACHPP